MYMDYSNIEYIESEIFIEKTFMYVEKYNTDLEILLLTENSNSDNITDTANKALNKLKDLHKFFIDRFFNNENRQLESFLLKIGEKIPKEEFSISFNINPEELYKHQIESMMLIFDNYDKPEYYHKFKDVNNTVPDLGKPTDLTIKDCIDMFHKFEKLSNLCERNTQIMYKSIIKRIKNRAERDHISNIGLYEMIHIMNIIHININRFSPKAIYNNNAFKQAVKKLIDKDSDNIKLIPNKFRDSFNLK